MEYLTQKAVTLLRDLISTPSFSREEHETANILENFFRSEKIPCLRHYNNVWAYNQHYDDRKSTILLNSHHDTVKPNSGYTRNPFEPAIEGEKLFGLGSNDAGGGLVSLLMTFLHFYERKHLPFNIAYAATAEEEISGEKGIQSITGDLKNIEAAIVGEPTKMEMAVAEKGLLVIGCTSHGRAGHAAREEGDNAIYKALDDIEWFRNFKFEKTSRHLGEIKMTVTIINSGTQHNVVPERCDFTVDIRVTDKYTHEEILETIMNNTSCEIVPKSMRIRSSFINPDHFLVRAAENLDLRLFGSPTTSDQALMSWPSVKIGPGDSARSHTANEFIYIPEIQKGIRTYSELLEESCRLYKQQLKEKNDEALGEDIR